MFSVLAKEQSPVEVNIVHEGEQCKIFCKNKTVKFYIHIRRSLSGDRF